MCAECKPVNARLVEIDGEPHVVNVYGPPPTNEQQVKPMFNPWKRRESGTKPSLDVYDHNPEIWGR